MALSLGRSRTMRLIPRASDKQLGTPPFLDDDALFLAGFPRPSPTTLYAGWRSDCRKATSIWRQAAGDGGKITVRSKSDPQDDACGSVAPDPLALAKTPLDDGHAVSELSSEGARNVCGRLGFRGMVVCFVFLLDPPWYDLHGPKVSITKQKRGGPRRAEASSWTSPERLRNAAGWPATLTANASIQGRFNGTCDGSGSCRKSLHR